MCSGADRNHVSVPFSDAIVSLKMSCGLIGILCGNDTPGGTRAFQLGSAKSVRLDHGLAWKSEIVKADVVILRR